MNVVISGSIAYDYLMSFPGHFAEHFLREELDHLSVSFLVDEMRRQRGGVATNIAYTLALLGEQPRVLGTAGQDFDEYRAWLEQQGVDTSLIRIESDLFTASCFINTDLEGNQIVSFYAGAMARAGELSIRDIPDFDQIDLVVVSPNDPGAMRKHAAECQAAEIPYLYDPSQQIIRLPKEDLLAGLEGCDLLIVNEYEFGMLREKTGLSEDQIRATPKQACIVTLGSKGTHIWAQDQLYEIPVVPPDHIDEPTGVGDAFRAGLIKGLALDLPWPLAGRLGAVSATFSLECFGPQEHCYTIPNFVARFRKHFDDQGALDVLLDEE